VLRDLNSANGTQLNGADVLPGADVPLHDGDSIAVGAWTRIAVRAVIS
jgi:pSer/pThr/pTyr-binding forkhead associated (FHA) protein